MRELKETIKDFPKAPGVYFFRGAKKEVLYVGKATSLRDRVRQYFSGHDSRGERIVRLVHAARKVQYQETESVLEALILESALIKKYQPKYNIDLKDDKSFSYFVVTKEEFPRVEILRETDFDKPKFQSDDYTKGKVFGPYTSTVQMRTALKIIRKIFPIHLYKQKTEKGCLDYHLGLCPGPYATTDDKISAHAYAKNVRGVTLMLSGKKRSLVQGLKKEMKKYADAEAYEEAEKVKRQIFALEHIRDISLLGSEKPLVTTDDAQRIECYDISNISGQHQVASMVVYENGEERKAAYRKFKIKAVNGANDIAAMREVLARRLNHLDDWGSPVAIVIDGGKGHLNMAEKLFTDLGVRRKGAKSIGLLAVAKGPTRKKVDVSASRIFAPAKNIIADKKTLESIREEAHRFAIKYHRQLRDKNLKK